MPQEPQITNLSQAECLSPPPPPFLFTSRVFFWGGVFFSFHDLSITRALLPSFWLLPFTTPRYLAGALVGLAVGARAHLVRGLGLGRRRLAASAVAWAGGVIGRLLVGHLVSAAFALACLAGAGLSCGGGAGALRRGLSGLDLVARAAAVVGHFGWLGGG